MTTNTFKVPDIKCLITGTDDTADGRQEKCKLCSYHMACTAKYNEEQLIEAQELHEEALRLKDESEKSEALSKELFGKVLKDNGLIKYQWNHFMILNITVHPYKTYPKAKLLKTFTEEQLEPACEMSKGSQYISIDDLLKVRKEKND